MYKDILTTIDGVAVFPVVSLVLFVAVFVAVLIRTARLDRGRLDRCARLPLDDHRDGPEPQPGDLR